MFIEPSPISRKHAEQKGQIEVICGSMFSGKTEELIRRVKRTQFANQKMILFKPEIDKRYSEEDVVSHQGSAQKAVMVAHSDSILSMVTNEKVVAIDEAQFFDEGIVSVCTQLANRGIRVICAGLDMDYLGKPFGPMPQLLAIADFITKLHAICMKCGDLATFSFRLSALKEKVVLGEKESYEARCRKCFYEDLGK